MRKLKKLASSFCSILLAASIMLGSAAPAFAADSVLPEESSSQITQNETLVTPESTVPDSGSTPADSSSVSTEPDSGTPVDSSSAPIDGNSTPTASSSIPPESENAPSSSDSGSSVPPDSDNVPTEPDSTPNSSTPADSSSVPADSSAPAEGEPGEEETPEEPPFTPLAIAAFTPQAEFLEDGQAKLSVTLNRDDVAVNYQWQVKKAVKVPELLFDYTNYSDTSYYFPYADLTEAELLEINPDATWPGIEMYLAAVEAAGMPRAQQRP